MRHNKKSAFAKLAACTLVLGIGGFAAGCSQRATVEETPAEAARQAVGITDDDQGKERSTAEERNVLVEKTTKVTDAKTGEVITTEKEVTPVTVKKEKTIDTDVNVDVGNTTKTVD
jgi:hypothetical protein